MLTIPQPKIGENYAINITTKNLDESFAFYQTLGFREIFRFDFPFPFIFITDGTINMMLRKDDQPYIALSYYVPNIKEKVAELEAEGIKFTALSSPSDMIQRYRSTSPDGVNLTLVTYVDNLVKPTGKTMLTMDQADYMNPEKYGNKTIGMFGELAHTVKDLEATIAYWDKLGFKVLSKHASPYPWAILSDGTSVVGAHQSNHFSGIGITYFAADMKNKIAALKEKGLTNYKELMGPNNIIVPTPEGQQVFLFSMGM
jgi:catechol 2,3-dioxygenase-like lactoylglutathione lyase family enzyme